MSEEELRELLDKYLAPAWLQQRHKTTEVPSYDLHLDEAMRAIHSYTQERELEARINEIDYLNNNFQEDAQDWMRDHPGYTTSMIPMEDYVKRRDELIAQLNKSKGE